MWPSLVSLVSIFYAPWMANFFLISPMVSNVPMRTVIVPRVMPVIMSVIVSVASVVPTRTMRYGDINPVSGEHCVGIHGWMKINLHFHAWIQDNRC